MTDEDRIIAAWQPVQGPSLPLQASHLAVVISNYNDASYLEECLKAIRAQLDDRMAFLFIDDGSQDNSVEIACRVLEDFPQACIVRNLENQGVIRNYNAALQSIQAPYVYFASSNDRIADNFFQEALTFIAKFPSAGLISGLCQKITENGEPDELMRTALPNTKACYLSAEEVKKIQVSKGSWIVGSSTIYRTEALRNNGCFNPDLYSATDGLAATRIVLSHGACFLPVICSYWRMSDAGFASTTLLNTERVEIILEAGNRYFSEVKSDGTGKVRKTWSREFLFWHVRACHRDRKKYLGHAVINRLSGIPMWRLSLLRLPLPFGLWSLLAAAVLAPFKFRHYLQKKIRWMLMAGKDLNIYS